ncbi:DUF2789 family protein [Zhongshania guokunii]|uniref:DUF2789 family protein n=1 Tax=Zhongshania guokunii TaxID=641783 RepID=A0ABV3U463_9GAMM
MEVEAHSLASLFKQLGLDNTEQAIQDFIKINAPLSSGVELHKAHFWSASQSSLLQQSKDDDADWAEIVDQLDAMLRRSDLDK